MRTRKTVLHPLMFTIAAFALLLASFFILRSPSAASTEVPGTTVDITADTHSPTGPEKPAGSPQCVTELRLSSNAFSWRGGIGTFDVLAASDCHWTAVADAGWLEIVSGQNGVGNGTVNYSVGKNSQTSLREANIAVDGLAHHVSQSRTSHTQCLLRFGNVSSAIPAAGGGGTVNFSGRPECAWHAVSDSPWLTIAGTLSGTGGGNISFSVPTNFAGTPRRGQISFGLDTGLVTVTQSPNLPPTVNAGADQVISLPGGAALNGTATDDGIGNPVTLVWSKVSGPESVIFSGANSLTTSTTFSKEGVYILRLTASDGYLTASDDVQVTVNPDPIAPPPDPSTTAPPIDPTVATNPFDDTKFLYSGTDPIQTGVAPGTIKPERVAVFRGRVVDKTGQPLSKVKITILNRTDYGRTMSRADGRFDLVVNGGGQLAVKYEKAGYIAVQRQETPQWQEFCPMPDVMMIAYDGNVSSIDLNAAVPVQVAQGGVMTDADGTRRSRLLFKQGTVATMRLPDGTIVPLTTINVRSTEFTVGPNGPEMMPGDLPGTSAYTYAAEYSLDEAVSAGAVETTFSQPVVQYNENFLNFPTGTVIPSGSYDRTTAQWIASASGRVVNVLSINAGTADLDINGNGQPATDPEYASLGIDIAERRSVAALYAVNQSLWRVPLIHFSPWDSNWPFSPPTGAAPPGGSPPPQGPAPASGNNPPPDECPATGCILGLEGQTLSENMALTGTPLFLRYDSSRSPDYKAANTLNIPLTGTALPGPLKRVDLKVTIAGRTFTQAYSPQTSQTAAFDWDGLDAYMRVMQGQQTATVDIGNTYDGFYQNTGAFGYNGNGTPITGDPARMEVTLHQVQRLQIGTFDVRRLSLGGWSLSAQHVYDPVGRTLYQGDGTVRKADSVNSIITTVAGSGAQGFNGDGGPATAAAFNFPFSATAAANGELYVNDSVNHRVRKVSQTGIVSTVAGNGGICDPTSPCGDGGQALGAQLTTPVDAEFGADGSMYIFDVNAFRVRKVAPDGVISTVVGNGQSCNDPTSACGDGGPATQAQLAPSPGCCHAMLFVAQDGTLYLTDSGSRRIRRVGTDGIITTIAGNGHNAVTGGCTVVGASPVLAVNACLSEPNGLAATTDGTIYFADFLLNKIFRVDSNGMIRVVAGDGVCGNTGDGGPALSARLCNPHSVALGPDGTLYLSDWSNARIRRIDSSGVIANYAGSGVLGFSGDGGPAPAAQIRQSIDVSVGPDGSVYIGEANNHRIRRVAPPFPGFNGTDILIPSEDGGQLFVFDFTGRHLRTVNAMTGANVYVFAYDSSGRLTGVTDGDGNVTTIERNGDGDPTGILSPYNQRTSLSLDSIGYLSRLTNPANESYKFAYTAGGLLTNKQDPIGNANTFTYNALGKLTRDDDAAAGFQTLTRTDQGRNYTVTHSTALGRSSTFQVQTLDNGDAKRISTMPDGTQSQTVERSNGTQSSTVAEGTITNTTLGPDPRWKMQAPLSTAVNVTTPGNLTYSTNYAKTVTLLDPADPLSLTSYDETLSLNGRTYSNFYTASSRTAVQTSPLSRQTTTITDLQGRVTQRQFADFNPTFYIRDSHGRLQTFTFGSGVDARSTSFGYDSFGQLTSLTDALSRTLTFNYDAAGRVTRQTLPDNNFLSYAFNANGNITSITPPGRPPHTFTFTPTNEVASYTAPNLGGNSTMLFQYDSDHQLSRITRPDSQQLNFGYDSFGRLATTTVPGGQYTYAYNAATGNITSITAPDGGNVSFTLDGTLLTRTAWAGSVSGSVGHTYDNFFRPVAQKVNDGNSISFTYDNDGLLTGAGSLSLTRHPSRSVLTGTSLFNITDSRTYNSFAELTGYNAKFSGSTLFDEQLVVDKLGRISQRTEINNGTTNTYAYSYDQNGRLTGVIFNGGAQAPSGYTYDSNNNRLTASIGPVVVNGTYDAQDRLTQYGGTAYTYTANGELLTRTNSGSTSQYSYDVIGNLRHVTLPDATQIDYTIDGLNHRIGKKVNGTATQGFLYLGEIRIIAELDGSNNLVSRFVYGSRSHVPDYMTKAGATYRLITDHLGSVRLVVDANTGAVAQRIDYDEFGVVIFDSNPGFQPFGFAGGVYDPQTKLVRFGSRDYDAETGRWTTKDPTLFTGNTGNLYEYVGSDPINYLDVTGLKADGNLISLAPDILRALRKIADTNGNLAGNLQKEAQQLVDQINKDTTALNKAKDALKELEDLLENFRRNKQCPTAALIKAIANKRREIASLDRKLLVDKENYYAVLAQIKFYAMAGPLADLIDTGTGLFDPGKIGERIGDSLRNK